MCGIAGYWDRKGCESGREIQEMTRMLTHRGPDAGGYWLWHSEPFEQGDFYGGNMVLPQYELILEPTIEIDDRVNTVAIGHRLYALQADVRQSSQPWEDTGKVFFFNGEIYNFRELRIELEATGVKFYTQSDIEVICKAWKIWGNACFARFRGFFAIVIHDYTGNQLILARDPLGKAPLYLIERPGFVAFASDIKPLFVLCPEERARVREGAVTEYLLHGLRDYRHQTFWQNIQSLPAGTWWQFDTESGAKSSGQFWGIPSQRQTAIDLPFDKATKRLKSLLQQSVQKRLPATRPVGLTLSGGLDSSAIAAFAAAENSHKIPVFTVRYQDPSEDETAFAKKVVAHFPGAFEHHMVDGLSKTVLDDWDAFMHLQEEPFHDPVLYTDFVQQQHMKQMGIGVTLMGAGGDEVLAGYPAYFPSFMRAAWAEKGMSALPELMADARFIVQNMPVSALWRAFKRRSGPQTDLLDGILKVVPAEVPPVSSDFSTHLREKMGDRLMNYWLRSLNKHYMGIPVEPRLPFLDQDLVDFCFQLPPEYLIHKGWSKYLLRKALEDKLPPEIVWRRRKMGFPFDTAAWLRTHARALQEKLATDTDNPWINTAHIIQRYESLRRADAQLLWRLICLSAWHQKMILGHGI